jgi:hypothetical protein
VGVLQGPSGIPSCRILPIPRTTQGHRAQAAIRLNRSSEEELMLQHDRKLYPEQMYNHRGEPVFARFPAKQLLEQDVKNKVHLKKTTTQLQASCNEYKIFDPDIFARRIKQEIRLENFTNYLEWKRNEKRIKFAKEAAKKKQKAMAKAEAQLLTNKSKTKKQKTQK